MSASITICTTTPRCGACSAGDAVKLPVGFTYRERRSGEIEVRHRGTLASTLRGRQAERFRERAVGATEVELQQLMARVTGNFKRGNERR